MPSLFRTILVLAILCFNLKTNAEPVSCPDNAHLIRTAVLSVAGLIILTSGLIHLHQSDTNTLNRVGKWVRGLTSMALGLTLIAISSPLIHDLDLMLKNP